MWVWFFSLSSWIILLILHFSCFYLIHEMGHYHIKYYVYCDPGSYLRKNTLFAAQIWIISDISLDLLIFFKALSLLPFVAWGFVSGLQRPLCSAALPCQVLLRYKMMIITIHHREKSEKKGLFSVIQVSSFQVVDINIKIHGHQAVIHNIYTHKIEFIFMLSLLLSQYYFTLNCEFDKT